MLRHLHLMGNRPKFDCKTCLLHVRLIDYCAQAFYDEHVCAASLTIVCCASLAACTKPGAVVDKCWETALVIQLSLYHH